jgi:hypothetical protein
MPRNRFENALEIQEGACNGLAVSKALHEAYREAYAEGKDTTGYNQDPAVQLILHQLCHLAGIPTESTNGSFWDWDRATAACTERSKPAA